MHCAIIPGGTRCRFPYGTAAPVADPITVPATAAQTTAGTPAPATQTASPVLTVPVTSPVPETSLQVIQNPPSGGLLGSLHLSVPLAGILLFLVITGALFALIRTGVLGIRLRETRPALALSAFFGLGGSLAVTCLLSGGTLPGTTCALIFMAAGTPLAAYLWHLGVMNRTLATGMAALATLGGFVFLAPIMPLELGGIVNVLTGATAISAGVLVILAVIAFTLMVGRAFCGAVCPVGSVQELAYTVPGKKVLIRSTRIPELIRLAVFGVTAIAALYLIDLMAITGLYDLFSLTFSASLLAAAGILLVSVFVYRPVCRILCPFGVLFSLPAEFSMFRLHRTEACISCRKCEKACPAGVAGKGDSKRECYLCGRCTDACKVPGALEYGRWHENPIDSPPSRSQGLLSEKTDESDR